MRIIEPSAAAIFLSATVRRSVEWIWMRPARCRAATPRPPRAVGVERSRAANGLPITEVFAQRTAVAEKPHGCRPPSSGGTDHVLGTTYLHVHDGSGSTDLVTHDLTATTAEAFDSVRDDGRRARVAKPGGRRWRRRRYGSFAVATARGLLAASVVKGTDQVFNIAATHALVKRLRTELARRRAGQQDPALCVLCERLLDLSGHVLAPVCAVRVDVDTRRSRGAQQAHPHHHSRHAA